ELSAFFDDAVRGWRTEPNISSPARLAAASAMLRLESSQAGESLLYQSPTHHLIRHWISNAASDQQYVDWAEDEVLRRIPSDLLRATEIYFDLFRDLHISVESQAIARRKIAEKARRVFLDMSPGEFEMSFPLHCPYT